jgi:hypothetical protein
MVPSQVACFGRPQAVAIDQADQLPDRVRVSATLAGGGESPSRTKKSPANEAGRGMSVCRETNADWLPGRRWPAGASESTYADGARQALFLLCVFIVDPVGRGRSCSAWAISFAQP